MPTLPLSLFSLLNTSISSYFSSPSSSNPNPNPDPKPTPSPSPPPRGSFYTMDVAELRRVFNMFDQNGDGRITTLELTNSLHSMGISIPDSELAQIISHIDVDGDGCVDGHEFESLYKLIMEREEEGEREEEKEENDEIIMEVFNVFDKNGDGFISGDELGCVLEALGLGQGRKMEDFEGMIMKVDGDGDGRVCFNEFKKMMKDNNGGFASFN